MAFCKAVSGGINVETKSFIWSIDNFDIVRQSEDYINDQKFTFKAGETLGLVAEWMIYLQPPKTEKKDFQGEKWIGCYLRLLKPPIDMDGRVYNGIVNASWQLSIRKMNLDSYGYFDYDRSTSIHNFMKNGKLQGNWGWPKLLRQDVMPSDLVLTKGSLPIKLKIQVCGAPKTDPLLLLKTPDITTLEKQHKIKFWEKMVQDLGQALDEPSQQSDAQTKIVSKDGVEFPVNRGILSARSPAFERMFQTEMSESVSGIVNVKDISSDTMSIILRFIYTGELKDDWRDSNVIAELVYAAGKYQLTDLINFLNNVVGKVCCKDTVVDLINLARKLSMKKAEKDLLGFMKKNITSYEDMFFFTQPPNDFTNQPDPENNYPEEWGDSEPGSDDD